MWRTEMNWRSFTLVSKRIWTSTLFDPCGDLHNIGKVCSFPKVAHHWCRRLLPWIAYFRSANGAALQDVEAVIRIPLGYLIYTLEILVLLLAFFGLFGPNWSISICTSDCSSLSACRISKVLVYVIAFGSRPPFETADRPGPLASALPPFFIPWLWLPYA
jgi:hypothetical protein